MSTGDVRGDAEHVDELVLDAEVTGLEEVSKVCVCVCVCVCACGVRLEEVSEVIAGQRLSRLEWMVEIETAEIKESRAVRLPLLPWSLTWSSERTCVKVGVCTSSVRGDSDVLLL